MKKKKTDWSAVPWTPFEASILPDHPVNRLDPPAASYINSRYQVTVYVRDAVPPFGPIAHLSIKTHDRAARHDWRDLQRIKNEICGPECDAVEIYPAESKLVDTSNQYHLFVFGEGYRLPFGFQTRLVADGVAYGKSRQRPWDADQQPADCTSAEEIARQLADLLPGGDQS